jgi:hypothetical protein
MNQRLKLYIFDNYYERLWCENWIQGRYHSGTYRHQKTATNTRTSPGLSHFGINCLQHLPLQTLLTVSRA